MRFAMLGTGDLFSSAGIRKRVLKRGVYRGCKGGSQDQGKREGVDGPLDAMEYSMEQQRGSGDPTTVPTE